MISDRIVTAAMCRRAQERVEAFGGRPALVRLSQVEPELASHVLEGLDRVWAKLDGYGFVRNGRLDNRFDDTFYPTVLGVALSSLEALREGHRKLWTESEE